MEQIVDFPTRQDNTLDLVFTSHPAFKLRCKSLPQLDKKGDHDIVLYDCSHKVVRSKPPRKKIYLWKKVPEENIISGAKQFGTDFTSMHFESIEHMWAVFKNGIISLMDTYVPTKRSSSRHTHPWVNTHTRRLSRKKVRAYRKAKRSTCNRDWDRYNKLKSETPHQMRKTQTDFIQNTVNRDIKENSKRFWSDIKSKRQEPAGISSLLNKDGFLHSDSYIKAEMFNHQFQSVYTKEDTTTLPVKGNSTIKSMNDIYITENGVIKPFKDLNPHKASGPDQIPTRLLKLCASELVPAVVRVFQTSLDSGIVPYDWKEALITPLFKKGDRNVASN